MSFGVVRACDVVRGRFGSRLSPCFLCYFPKVSSPSYEVDVFVAVVLGLPFAKGLRSGILQHYVSLKYRTLLCERARRIPG